MKSTPTKSKHRPVTAFGEWAVKLPRKGKSMHTTSKHRFVKEYANYKIRILEDLKRSFPEKEVIISIRLVLIREAVKRWDRGEALADDVMKYIAEA